MIGFTGEPRQRQSVQRFTQLTSQRLPQLFTSARLFPLKHSKHWQQLLKARLGQPLKSAMLSPHGFAQSMQSLSPSGTHGCVSAVSNQHALHGFVDIEDDNQECHHQIKTIGSKWLIYCVLNIHWIYSIPINDNMQYTIFTYINMLCRREWLTHPTAHVGFRNCLQLLPFQSLWASPCRRSALDKTEA